MWISLVVAYFSFVVFEQFLDRRARVLQLQWDYYLLLDSTLKFVGLVAFVFVVAHVAYVAVLVSRLLFALEFKLFSYFA